MNDYNSNWGKAKKIKEDIESLKVIPEGDMSSMNKELIQYKRMTQMLSHYYEEKLKKEFSKSSKINN